MSKHLFPYFERWDLRERLASTLETQLDWLFKMLIKLSWYDKSSGKLLFDETYFLMKITFRVKDGGITDRPLGKKFAKRLAWRFGAISLHATFQHYDYFETSTLQNFTEYLLLKIMFNLIFRFLFKISCVIRIVEFLQQFDM